MTVIVVLVGLFKAVASPVIDLTKTITTLIVSVDGLSKDLTESTARNHESHSKLWEYNKEQDAKLNIHDIEINCLKNK